MVASLIALFISTSSAHSRGSFNASPELAIDSTERNFGEVFAGEELEAAFAARNIGAAPLELDHKSLTPQAAAARREFLNSSSEGYRPMPVAAVSRRAAPS